MRNPFRFSHPPLPCLIRGQHFPGASFQGGFRRVKVPGLLGIPPGLMFLPFAFQKICLFPPVGFKGYRFHWTLSPPSFAYGGNCSRNVSWDFGFLPNVDPKLINPSELIGVNKGGFPGFSGESSFLEGNPPY